MCSRRFQRRDFVTTCTAGAVSILGASSAARMRAAKAAAATNETLTVDCDFPGGNIAVERIEGDHVDLHQDPRDTPGFWFYWYFRVRGAAGRTLTFHFTQGNVIGARGPAVSTDGGKRWTWLGMESVEGASFAYSVPQRADDVHFCLAVPYLEANLHQFLRRHAENPHLKVETHAVTKKGRKIERLRLGKLDGTPQHRVLLTCRHHACEMMANWALEGNVEAVLADSTEGSWFRRNVELLAVPFMDKDGVEDGDQGKNRRPHDHNRDYLGESIYRSTAALRQFVPKWSDGRLKIALDMHCPWIRGGGDGPSSNEQIFFVGNPSQQIWRRQQQFSNVLETVQSGPLAHHSRHNIPWGQSWNTVKEPKSCSRWTALLSGVLVGVTIEIPYANAGGKPVTPETARRFGRDLAGAMRRYLKENAALP